MSQVILHLKEDGKANCVVCGADLTRSVSHWWLSNCWTADRRHYREQEACRPGAYVRPWLWCSPACAAQAQTLDLFEGVTG